MIGVLVKKGCIWSSITCDCECDKACKISEYLGIKNWVCKKRFFGELVLG